MGKWIVYLFLLLGPILWAQKTVVCYKNIQVTLTETNWVEMVVTPFPEEQEIVIYDCQTRRTKYFEKIPGHGACIGFQGNNSNYVLKVKSKETVVQIPIPNNNYKKH